MFPKTVVEVSKFAILEDLDAEVEVNNAWETIRENIKISAKESRLFRIEGA
jgi:hypothetical protein